MTWISDPYLPFTIDAEEKPPRLTLRLHGDLDFGCASALASAARVPIRGVTKVRLDLTELDFCDVAGLHALDDLCSMHRASRREVEVIGARPFIRKIAAISGFLPQCLEQRERQDQ